MAWPARLLGISYAAVASVAIDAIVAIHAAAAWHALWNFNSILVIYTIFSAATECQVEASGPKPLAN